MLPSLLMFQLVLYAHAHRRNRLAIHFSLAPQFGVPRAFFCLRHFFVLRSPWRVRRFMCFTAVSPDITCTRLFEKLGSTGRCVKLMYHVQLSRAGLVPASRFFALSRMA
ncbi:unnamed protein product, partial [Ectocarpus sp. 4 AP-2014]